MPRQPPSSRSIPANTNPGSYPPAALAQELDALVYAISHDLQAPLRAISGFGLALEEEAGDQLNEPCRHYLKRMRVASHRMSEMIEALVKLTRLGRRDLERDTVDLSALAWTVMTRLQEDHPDRPGELDVAIAEGMIADADPEFVGVILTELLENAWKFTVNCKAPVIEFACMTVASRHVFCVRDNGIGFDASSDRVFVPFQRFCTDESLTGIGTGLATVRRLVHRHGGRVWIESGPGQGTAVYFTLTDDNCT